jgi:MSHA biogenesis protein MshP
MSAKAERGFALVTAIFVLLMVTTVGMVLLRGSQYASGEGLLLGLHQRAEIASQTGLDWASYRIRRSGNCLNSTLNLNQGALKGFSVRLRCTRTVHGAGAAARTVFNLDALARFGSYGRPDYVSSHVLQTLII